MILTKKYRLIVKDGIICNDYTTDYGNSFTHVGKGLIDYESDSITEIEKIIKEKGFRKIMTNIMF